MSLDNFITIYRGADWKCTDWKVNSADKITQQDCYQQDKAKKAPQKSNEELC